MKDCQTDRLADRQTDRTIGIREIEVGVEKERKIEVQEENKGAEK
jgi:hypothetical protein